MFKTRRRFKEIREPMGLSPAVLAKRKTYAVKEWCPDKPNLEFDPMCDAENPKTIHFRDITKAMCILKPDLPKTPMMLTHNTKINMKLYFKLESENPTKSFLDRGALYALKRLSEEQRAKGVITASLGNFAVALAYHGQKLGIPVHILLPEDIPEAVEKKCSGYGAKVIVRGRDLAESKQFACRIYRNDMTYINGYDHPHVIAAGGVVALEALHAAPHAHAILVPAGGGGLLAGVAVAAKRINRDILVYGIQPNKSCSFFKAMQNDFPYKTVAEKTIASELRVNTAGYNAFHTAKSLVDKMILVSDDDIARAVLHLAEHEKLLVSGAGAAAFAGVVAAPNAVPELRNKTVICIITSSNNIHILNYSEILKRALFVEGRFVKFEVDMDITDSEMSRQLRTKILKIVTNVGCQIIDINVKNHKTDAMLNTMTVVCESKSLQDSCSLKRVLNSLVPGKAVFLEDPFSPIPTCACFPQQTIQY